MHLIVARADPSFAVDNKAPVGDLAVVEQHGKGAEVDPYAVALGRILNGREHSVLFFAANIAGCSGAFPIEQA